MGFSEDLNRYLRSLDIESMEPMVLETFESLLLHAFLSLSEASATWMQWSGRQKPHAIDAYYVLKTLCIHPKELEAFLRTPLASSLSHSTPSASHPCPTEDSPRGSSLTGMGGLPRLHIPWTTYEGPNSPSAEPNHASTIPENPNPFGEPFPPVPAPHTFKHTPIPIEKNLSAQKISIHTSLEKLSLERNLKNLLRASDGGPRHVTYDD